MAALKYLLHRLTPVLCFAMLGPPLASQAQDAVAEVEVRSVKFSDLRPRGSNGAWLEATVELAVRAATGGGVYARYVDGVRVTLAIGIRKRDDNFVFFRSSQELVSLEAGRAFVRFYLPPEIVAREQLNKDPYAYSVEVGVGGRAVTGVVAPSLRSPEAKQSFYDRVARSGPANDGIFVPQHESPFASEYAGDTPTAIRRSR